VTIDERRLAWRERGKATARARAIGERPGWRQRLRTYIVDHGIQVMCGSGGDVSAAAATDIPLVSGAARLAWLKALNVVGITRFVATSGLGYEFVCHTGDLASFPFYHRRAYQAELELCAAWLDGEDNPVVYDVGANGGFFSTHLAQMLAARTPRVYAFEPVPATFEKLAQAVERLGLNASVLPVPAAVVDNAGPVRISYSERNSLLARISPRGLNPQVGDQLVQAGGITLDEFRSSAGAFPQLVKIDVEGSEPAVLRGARGLLSRPDRPAVMFECNPVALTESGSSVRALLDLLADYTVHYVDDLGGQKIPFGDPVDAEKIGWTCNLFAVPLTRSAAERWASVLNRSKPRASMA
jgi:FkbM family methyltransferase